MNAKKYKNKYDRMITLLLASMAFGNIGGALQVSRILTILFIPFFVQKFNICKRGYNNYWYFFIFFIVYCLLSLIWTPDKTEGVVQLIYFVIHFLFFFEILFFSKLAANANDSITNGWMLSVSLTLIVALWEIITDNHLSLSAHDSERMINTGEAIFQQRFAAVTFYNYNSYVTFLCFALPFIFCRIVGVDRLNLKNIVPILVILLSFFCILCNASRGGLLSIILMLFIYIIRSPKSKFKNYTLFFVFLIGAYVLTQFADILFLAISARSSAGGLFEGSSRFYIWGVALQTFVHTLGFGTGIGGVSSSMAKFTTGITVPHNLFLEILLEFGFIIFIIFMIFILKIYYKSFKVKDKKLKSVLYIALIPFPIYSIIDSGYLLNYWVFAFFSSLIYFKNSYILPHKR